ncbi:uncharacterized protein MYCGRDRAFT_91757 [Zymoseptoria tritici IPO323]|uniref:Uncharacterized protein n=1 Tax=Zymoseptoria tritici (strain CBS 115943 / IPO323) TaxID=336722 RepID=F9X5Q2_ZYMTI|nr:uncharacterized protein MYCGRDRAFT_91757 [Zymoseptoria tritici IPO323]EGP88838.1 hypothetical protein MYCGRDRAFT_91757 [Zymoseptoria tritici IPO323]
MSTLAAGQPKKRASTAMLRRRAVVINGLLYAPLVPAIRTSWRDLDTLDVIQEDSQRGAKVEPRRRPQVQIDPSLGMIARAPVTVIDVSAGHVNFAATAAPARRRTQLAPIQIAPRGPRTTVTIANQAPLNTPAMTMGPPSSIPMLRSMKLPNTRRQSQQQGLRFQWQRSKNRFRNLFDI